jgi:hypothetical protein
MRFCCGGLPVPEPPPPPQALKIAAAKASTIKGAALRRSIIWNIPISFICARLRIVQNVPSARNL